MPDEHIRDIISLNVMNDIELPPLQAVFRDLIGVRLNCFLLDDSGE
jgi:hypothetical protein